MSFDTLFNAPKMISRAPVWTRSNPENAVLWFDTEIEIDGVTEANFTLHGECRIDMIDQNVGLELVYRTANGYRRHSLARIDWRSIRGGHSNPRRRGWPRPIARAPDTHYHSFELNWLSGTKMRPGDLPIADKISEELQAFESLRSFAGILFRISNIDIVPRPPWEYKLL